MLEHRIMATYEDRNSRLRKQLGLKDTQSSTRHWLLNRSLLLQVKHSDSSIEVR